MSRCWHTSGEAWQIVMPRAGKGQGLAAIPRIYLEVQASARI